MMLLQGIFQTLGRTFYDSQTKIVEGRTNISDCIFEALFFQGRTKR